MAAFSIKTLLSFADVISSELKGEKNALMYSVGNLADKEAAFEAEYWGTPGIACRPAKANPDAASGTAQALSVNSSGNNIILAMRDLRTNEMFGQLGEGETAVYCSHQGRMLLKDDGSINLFTTEGNVNGGPSMGVFIASDGSIKAVSSKGSAMIIDEDGAKMFSAAGAVQVTDSVTKISNTAKVAISAPSIVIGGPASTAIANLPEMTQILTMLAAIQAEIVAIQAHNVALAALPVVLGPLVVALPTYAASTAAVTAGTVAVTAGSLAIPTAMALKRVTSD